MAVTPKQPSPDTRERSVQALQRAAGRLATAATGRMDSDRPWFRDLTAQERSWVGTIVQNGIRGFVEWYAAGAEFGTSVSGRNTAIAATMFGSVPRALTGIITLQQTVDLVRLSIEVVEANVDHLLDPDDAADVRRAINRYAREVAFATAEVYARAAEQRGAWDARLEALVVDAVLRAETDEALLSRASALSWDATGALIVVLGPAPQQPEGVPVDRAADIADSPVFDEVRRRARTAGLAALCATQGERLVVLLGGIEDARAAAETVVDLFGEGPVVAGPIANGLTEAHASARAALAGYRAAQGWPQAPRPVLSADLLPERVLAGDGHARRYLVEHVYRPLEDERGPLVDTLTAYFESGGSLEATARRLFVHVNTVRYRLRQIEDLTGYHAGEARDAFVLRIALTLGLQSRQL